MSKQNFARRVYHLPDWLTSLVHELTGWQVIRRTIRRRDEHGRTISESTSYHWSRSRRIMPNASH